MKKLVILLIAIALGVMFLWSPLSARDHDPTKPLPWMESGAKPNGDEGPWSEADSIEDEGIIGMLYIKTGIPKYIVLYFVPKSILPDDNVEENVSFNRSNTDCNRTTPTD
jgi:hypothetical protein